jgi:CheY-like chemotaxis protein
VGDRPRILLVDDYDPYRACVAHYLRTRLNAEVVEARDGLVGLEQARRQNFDVIVLDIEMPQMDGIELFERLTREHAARTVFVTGGGRAEREVWLGQFDPWRVLRKPVCLEKLTAVIKTIKARPSLQRSERQP